MSAGSFDHLKAPRGLWLVVLCSGALTLGFGFIGLEQYGNGSLTSLYQAVQMLILHTPHFEHGMNGWMHAGCWFGAITFFATALGLFWKRITREWRLVRLAWWWRRHYVVCGLGEMGMDLVRSLKSRHPAPRVVVIDPHPDESFVKECEALGVCVIEKDARKPEALEQAKVSVAREVVVITPDDETNVQIAVEVQRACAAKSSGMVECFVHLANINLRERLQTLAGNVRGKGVGCTLNFFDLFDNEARRVLTLLPLEGPGISADDPRSVHVVILGFGRMGRSLAQRAAKMGHFANCKPLRISVIDRDAKLQRERFLFRYPALEKNNTQGAAICDLAFYEAEAESITARKQVECWASEPDTLLHVFICVDENTRAIELALRFQEALVRHPDCNLLVRIKAQSLMSRIFNLSPKGGPRIQAFGVVEGRCCEEAFRHEQNEAFARAAHNDFVKKRGGDSNRTLETDPALADWSQLRDEFRESNRQQADHAPIKLRAIGCEMVELSDPREAITQFKPREVEVLAELEHTRWCAERWLDGWRYGPPFKKDQRISENLCPWGDLDDSIKRYDREAVANIPELLRLANPPMKVVRKYSA